MLIINCNFKLSIANDFLKVNTIYKIFYKFFTKISEGSFEIMIEVPQSMFFNGFYIWFDKEKRIEYYATPLYLYYADKKDYTVINETTVYLQEDISKVKPSKKPSNDILKHPATIVFPYKEKLGNMLVRFLNTDFSSFEDAYNNFFYAYGFELLKEFAPAPVMANRYSSEKELYDVLKRTWKWALGLLVDLQYNFKSFVDFLYNLNGNEEMKSYSVSSKFIAYMIKHKSDVYGYAYDIDIFRDNYADKQLEYDKMSILEIVEKLDNGTLTVPVSNIYTSEKLSNILYIILEELCKTENSPIKLCQNCGKYFIPTSRVDEIYCDFSVEVKGLTCRELGANLTYKKNLENTPALLQYRRTYQKKVMNASRNPDNKRLRKEFDKWKKEAQAKIKLYKQGKLTEEKLYEWMIENK